jgi:hypothetical protein
MHARARSETSTRARSSMLGLESFACASLRAAFVLKYVFGHACVDAWSALGCNSCNFLYGFVCSCVLFICGHANVKSLVAMVCLRDCHNALLM